MTTMSAVHLREKLSTPKSRYRSVLHERGKPRVGSVGGVQVLSLQDVNIRGRSLHGQWREEDGGTDRARVDTAQDHTAVDLGLFKIGMQRSGRRSNVAMGRLRTSAHRYNA
jgi:hypothetical protein